MSIHSLALTFGDLTRTLVKATGPSMKEQLQAMADAPLTGPRFPADPTEEVIRQREDLRDRLDAEQAEFDAFPPGGWGDEASQYEEMPE